MNRIPDSPSTAANLIWFVAVVVLVTFYGCLEVARDEEENRPIEVIVLDN